MYAYDNVQIFVVKIMKRSSMVISHGRAIRISHFVKHSNALKPQDVVLYITSKCLLLRNHFCLKRYDTVTLLGP